MADQTKRQRGRPRNPTDRTMHNVHIDDLIWARLQAQAQRDSISISDALNMMADEGLAAQEKRAKGAGE